MHKNMEIMEEYGNNGIFSVGKNRCGGWTENRKFTLNDLIVIGDEWVYSLVPVQCNP